MTKTDDLLNITPEGEPTRPLVTSKTDSDANVYRVDVHTAAIDEPRSAYHAQDPGEDALEPETAVKKGDATEANPNGGRLSDEETWRQQGHDVEARKAEADVARKGHETRKKASKKGS